MVGSAIVRALKARGDCEVLTAPRAQVDCRNQAEVSAFVAAHRPTVVVIAAARVGGIHANDTYPADFIYDNLLIEANLIHAAHRNDVQRIVFLGSSCIYPKHAEQPMREACLLTGPLEPTNEPYALAKIAGIKLCESYNRQFGRDYRSLMPTNLYGPGDNFHPENSHVIPGLIQRFHAARLTDAADVSVWGSGRARREFLFVDDLAEAVIFIMRLAPQIYRSHTAPQLSHINVGTGTDVSIAELAETVRSVVGFDGALTFDTSKPDGTPRKLLDTSLINSLGWHPQVSLQDGLNASYEWFCEHQDELRR